MKKEKLTKKQVMAMYEKVIKLSYCEAQSLLRCRQRIGYTEGIYGWNADVYNFGKVAIVTGYRPFGNIRPDYDLVKEYEEEAERIIKGNYEWNIIESKLDELLNWLIIRVTEEE